jgi:hypothetical protein
MIPCPSHTDLQDLLAERLPGEQERLLLAHVETCAACQRTLEELTAAYGPGSVADGLSPSGEAVPEPDSFWRGLKAAFPRQDSTPPQTQPIRVVARLSATRQQQRGRSADGRTVGEWHGPPAG